MNTNNMAVAEEAYRRASSALRGAKTLPEAKRIYGARGHSALRNVAVRYPELEKIYRELTRKGASQVHRATTAAALEREARLIEDVEFLAETGVPYHEAAKRLGKNSTHALEMALYRARRPDLLARLKQNQKRVII